MVTFAEMLRRWERINIVEVASEAMEVTKEEYFVSQRDQMSDGLLKTGGNITPMYAASTIKKKKKKGQETSHVTLEDTGGFKKDFFMDVRETSYVIGSVKMVGRWVLGLIFEKRYTTNVWGIGGSYKARYIPSLKKAMRGILKTKMS